MSSESESNAPAEGTREESNKTQVEIHRAEEAKLRAKYPGLQRPGVKMSVEKEQEAKLRSKYPGLKGPGSSAFLQKRLSKGQKYFDSGDYNMAKAKKAMPPPPAVKVVPSTTSGPVFMKPIPTDIITDATGDTIPTPETLATRKPSLVQSKLVTETTCSP